MEEEQKEPQTRAELVDDLLWQATSSAKSFRSLIDHTDTSDMGDMWTLRIEIEQAINELKAAAKNLDRELGRDTETVRRGDYVVRATSSRTEKERPKGGDWEPLRREVLRTALDTEADVDAAMKLLDVYVKIWSAPPSKLPSKPQLKKLGINPDEWIMAETVNKSEVKVWTVDQFEEIFGSAPREILIPKTGEPF